MTLLKCLLVFVLLGAPASASGAQPPSRVVQDFYRWAMHPTRQELAGPRFDPVRSLVGKDLLSALEAQHSYESACARLVPADIKPHMIDQNIFFSAPEGAKSLKSVSQTISGDVARASVNFAYDDLHWTDIVLLGQEDGSWVILDIEWQEGPSLTKRLAEFANHRCAPGHPFNPGGLGPSAQSRR